jgi:hypothetical protein
MGLLVKASMWSVPIVQVGYKTPIKPALEKYSTVGTRGMDRAFSFKPKRGSVAESRLAAIVTAIFSGQHGGEMQYANFTLVVRMD